MVFGNRFSYIKIRTFYKEYLVFQDTWSLMAVVSREVSLYDWTVTRDHLSWETTLLCPMGWSFKTGSTVYGNIVSPQMSCWIYWEKHCAPIRMNMVICYLIFKTRYYRVNYTLLVPICFMVFVLCCNGPVTCHDDIIKVIFYAITSLSCLIFSTIRWLAWDIVYH